MRSTSPTTTQTTCDCEDCESYTLTGHLRRTPVQADRHHQQAAVDGWQDVEGRDYCPGCPPGLPVEEHDHDGLWVDAASQT
ncbi:hypothetical protein ACIGD1_11405 [Streptomyces sp. NPDC085612]|uniref:hypothetical protein n=1 Tax=Streptomyces sp. NPDC085612 TaxID=3365732 RepID=UPI0037D1D4BE